jgi:FkbM family methyltransferase
MSYAQHGEDIDIENLVKKYQIEPLVIDIGAGDGLLFSNSRLFIEKYKFRGILFEPSPEPFKLLEEFYNGTDIECINIGISDLEYNYVIKHNPRGNQDHWTLNSIEIGISDKKSIRISKFLKERNINKVGIMSIDTEGSDTKILKELIEFSDVRPDIIIIEAYPITVIEEQKQILIDYDLARCNGDLNNIFIHKRFNYDGN